MLRPARRWCWREADKRTEIAILFLRRLPYREYLRTAHWERVRTLALERARRTCALCPSTRRLEVHHRSYARRGFEAPEDVIVLCDECHGRHHKRMVIAEVSDPKKQMIRIDADQIRWLQGA